MLYTCNPATFFLSAQFKLCFLKNTKTDVLHKNENSQTYWKSLIKMHVYCDIVKISIINNVAYQKVVNNQLKNVVRQHFWVDQIKSFTGKNVWVTRSRMFFLINQIKNAGNQTFLGNQIKNARKQNVFGNQIKNVGT